MVRIEFSEGLQYIIIDTFGNLAFCISPLLKLNYLKLNTHWTPTSVGMCKVLPTSFAHQTIKYENPTIHIKDHTNVHGYQCRFPFARKECQ